ncbi:MAG: beta-N-acetylhexosaminidase, partial [Alistipes sp.]|nr:beta-N-acetylhexosaminidase [Alistipes sp.]
MRLTCTFVISAVIVLLCGCSLENRHTVYQNIIPLPDRIETGKGSYALSQTLRVSYSSQELYSAANYLADGLKDFARDISLAEGTGGDIRLRLAKTNLAEGGYRMEVGSGGIELVSESYAGLISAASTLLQAVELSALTGEELPCVKITDEPEYQWRGIMLDVARHYFNADEVKQLLDWMALYKFNKFHWHLTDDQGWRIQLDTYPVLANEGGFRTLNNHDHECYERAALEDNPYFLLPADLIRIVGGDTFYGGFYTKEQIREVVNYAAVRGIDVIPEIDMPGHSMRTLMYYPELSCFGNVGWGKHFSTPMCPGKDETLEFCKSVWAEVFELFPYRYVHIGGDEVEKDNWRKCPHCKARMEQYGLENVEQLQSWFIDDMVDFFAAHGRRMVGWDEMLDGGLSPPATVVWWRP